MSLPTKWVAHIDAWQRSGLNQSAYCHQQGLNYKTFAARLCDYRKTQHDSPPMLIPVNIQKSPSPSEIDSILLTHRNGHRLTLPATVSAAWVAELLRCLD